MLKPVQLISELGIKISICLASSEEVNLLKTVASCWTEISQELINGAIDQWARRIDAVIRARGRHIEHLFD